MVLGHDNKLFDGAHYSPDKNFGPMYPQDRWHAVADVTYIMSEFIPACRRYWADPSVRKKRWEVNEFPYSEQQVVEALSVHEDQNGKICCDATEQLFPRCDCHAEDGKRRVCVPPKKGFQCKRSCILIKDHLVMEYERKTQIMAKREMEEIMASMETAKEVRVQN
jgi:hypothetical protein